MGKRKAITKQEAKDLAGCLTIIGTIFIYPFMWIWKGSVWVVKFLWELIKPLVIKVKDAIFYDHADNEQNKDAK